MTIGKRHKWTGSLISVMTGLSGASPLPAITGISKANPAVVTKSAHGLIDGDVVLVDDVTGMTQVNELLVVVHKLTNDTFALLGVDSRDYDAYVSGGTFDKAAFSNFCEATTYNRQGGSAGEINATSLCSEAKEYELDLPDYGTTQIGYNEAPGTTVYEALADSNDDGEMLAIKRRLPKNDRLHVQLGFVQQMSDTGGNGAIWTGSITLRNTGKRQRFTVAA